MIVNAWLFKITTCALSDNIVKAHVGDLRVKSTEGEGAELIIHLPIEN